MIYLYIGSIHLDKATNFSLQYKISFDLFEKSFRFKQRAHSSVGRATGS